MTEPSVTAATSRGSAIITGTTPISGYSSVGSYPFSGLSGYSYGFPRTYISSGSSLPYYQSYGTSTLPTSTVVTSSAGVSAASKVPSVTRVVYGDSTQYPSGSVRYSYPAAGYTTTSYESTALPSSVAGTTYRVVPSVYSSAVPTSAPIYRTPPQIIPYGEVYWREGPPQSPYPSRFPPAPGRAAFTKAVLVGINYRDTEKELFGCINDIRCVARFLEDQGWERPNIVLMDESQSDQRLQPTARNIRRAMKWLVEGAQPGDALFFAFSGHGSQVVDTSGDEKDGLDECMVAVDEKFIVDDEIYEILAKNLAQGVHLTAITDCCHSGTILDLPFEMLPDKKASGPDPRKYRLPCTGTALCFSACQDEQESGDVDSSEGASSGGACTNALLTALSELGPDASLRAILRHMAESMKARGLPQLPTVSSTHPINPRKIFSLTPRTLPIRPLPVKQYEDDLNPYVDFIKQDEFAVKSMKRKAASGAPRTRGFLGNLAKKAVGEIAQQMQPQLNQMSGGAFGQVGTQAQSQQQQFGASQLMGMLGGGGVTAAPQSAQAATTSMISSYVRMFSGCQDEQTSADVSNTAQFSLPANAGPGGAGGACTNSLLATLLGANRYLTWIEVLDGMRKILKEKGYSQIPQLSSSLKIELKDPFKIVTDAPNTRLRALLVGINYTGQQGQLSGCVNDVLSMRQFLQNLGYKDMRIMVDDPKVSQENPTRANILGGFRWLVEGAKEGDSLFFHYSGHGGQVRDSDGEEADGMDETIIPVDYRTAGQITDDEILKSLILQLPPRCQLTAVMDCCHSGTVMDLPFVFKADAINTAQAVVGQATMVPNSKFNAGQLIKIGMQLFQQHQAGQKVNLAALAPLLPPQFQAFLKH